MSTVKFSPRQTLPTIDPTEKAPFGAVSSYLCGNGQLAVVIGGRHGRFTLKGDDQGTMLEVTDSHNQVLGMWRLLPGRVQQVKQRTPIKRTKLVKRQSTTSKKTR